jgi:uncharacterized protein
MVRLKPWQWLLLILPIGVVVSFVLIAASLQIHAWGLTWVWAVIGLIFLAWRWLLVHWTKPVANQVETIVATVSRELENQTEQMLRSQSSSPVALQIETMLQQVLTETREDLPIWDDWPTFWQRCQRVVVTVAQAYHPEVKYPLLNIYIPQAYGLIRGTVDDLDQVLDQLAPVLNQVTVGQAYQAYEVYRQLEPSARKLWQVWSWAQWFFNPAAAVARTLSQKSSNQANQQLLVNLSQLLREATLRNLVQRSVALYGGEQLPATFSRGDTRSEKPLSLAKTQTLKEIFATAEPSATVEQTPLNLLLIGRTGAGKSSLINTLFQTEQAAVDVLPNTDEISLYHWQSSNGEILNLIDSPGYEQANRADLRDQVLTYSQKADLVLLVNPALDPALQMDLDFLKTMKINRADLPIVCVVTQVDRLRPLREWNPPYYWQTGTRAKEISIREALTYRLEQLGEDCRLIYPLVTQDAASQRSAWNVDELSLGLMEAISTSKQVRLARFLRNQDARVVAAAKIIDHYAFTMSTTQGLTALLKSPALRYLSMMLTGSELLAVVLVEKIPVEQAPVVIGKLQMAYELFSLLNADPTKQLSFDLLTLWPLFLDNQLPSDQSAWQLGHGLVDYWLKGLSFEQLKAQLCQTSQKQP